VSPASGVAQDFSQGPVVYTVTDLNGNTQDYRVEASQIGKSSDNTITSLTINGKGVSPDAAGAFAFNTSDFQGGYDVTKLSPAIVLHDSTATVSPASGTVQDFTSAVVYTVTAQNGATKDYTITVKRSNVSTIKEVSLWNKAGTLADTTFTFNDVPAGTDITTLRPTITLDSPKATVSPASGTVQDFTNPVVYTVTAEDGTSQDYAVIVTLSDKKDITSFKLGTVTKTPTDADDHVIRFDAADLPEDVTKLIPTIAISPKATITQASGVQQNFSVPVKYTVTAQDGTKQDYTVIVALSNKKSITKFTIHGVEGDIDSATHIIAFAKAKNTALPVGTDITKLIPAITIDDPLRAKVTVLSGTSGAVPASGVEKDFSKAVTYTVTAQDGTAQDYTVIVTLRTEKELTGLTITGGTVTSLGDNGFLVDFPKGTNLSSFMR
jgi:hypothetical protein